MPGEWDSKLNTFQKLIVLKSLRSDKITLAVQNFVVEHLGQPFVEPPVFNLQKSYKDSSITTPLIFVLSKGSDPVASFERFAEESNMSKKCEKISLGRGQGPKAEQMINENLNRGGWVLLMNCHLSVSWMPKLEAIVEQEVERIESNIDPRTEEFDVIEIRPKKADIDVRHLSLAWAPSWRADGGKTTPAWQ